MFEAHKHKRGRIDPISEERPRLKRVKVIGFWIKRPPQLLFCLITVWTGHEFNGLCTKYAASIMQIYLLRSYQDHLNFTTIKYLEIVNFMVGKFERMF